MTIGQEGHDLLRRAQDLLRHCVPNGDPAVIVERALAVLVADLEKKKFALNDHPRTARSVANGSRHIPASVRREVWKRDGRCAFVVPAGPRVYFGELFGEQDDNLNGAGCGHPAPTGP